MVVDDQPELARLVGQFLKRLGFEAETSGSGEDAWERFRADPSLFDAFLIDLTLPNMQGDELARRILSEAPGALILLCSGHPLEPSELRGANYLQKPFSPGQLAEKIGAMFGAED